jgi:flagellar motor switch protein FliN/FliY
MPEDMNVDPSQDQEQQSGPPPASSPGEPAGEGHNVGAGVDDEEVPTFESIGMFKKEDDEAFGTEGTGQGQNAFPDLSGVGQAAPFAQRAEFQQLAPATSTETFHNNIDLLLDVRMPVAIELGRTELPIAELLTLGPGSVIELNKLAGEPVDLLVNSKIIARGEVVVVDENFGVRVTSLLSPEERVKSLAME